MQQQDLGTIVAQMFFFETKDAWDAGSWKSLSPEEKNLDLFRRQKALLETFPSTGAISRARHDKSLNCLIEKMGLRNER